MSDKEKDLFTEAGLYKAKTVDVEEKVEAEKEEVVVKEGEIEEPKADTYVDDLEYDVDDDTDIFVDDELDGGEDVEEPTEEFLDDLNKSIFGELIQKDDYVEEKPKKKTPQKAPTKDSRGITLAGRVRSKNAPNKYKQLSNGQLMRRGVYKINDDEPIRHIGKGTLSSDIPKKKNKKG